MSDRLLWFDAETTGLKYRTQDVVLEVAWVITDMELNQLSPLHRVSTEWRPPTSHELHRPVPGSNDWSEAGGVHGTVLEMHRQSGLAAEWPDRVHVEAEAVGELITNDLGVTRDGDGEVYLAGAGVSHFDQRLLAMHVPSLAPKDEGGRLHYRCFDVSVAALVFGAPSMSVASMRELHGVPPQVDGGLLLCPCLAIDGPVPTFNGLLVLDSIAPHRAADDVALTVAYARALRSTIPLDSPVQLG